MYTPHFQESSQFCVVRWDISIFSRMTRDNILSWPGSWYERRAIGWCLCFLRCTAWNHEIWTSVFYGITISLIGWWLVCQVWILWFYIYFIIVWMTGVFDFMASPFHWWEQPRVSSQRGQSSRCEKQKRKTCRHGQSEPMLVPGFGTWQREENQFCQLLVHHTYCMYEI